MYRFHQFRSCLFTILAPPSLSHNLPLSSQVHYKGWGCVIIKGLQTLRSGHPIYAGITGTSSSCSVEAVVPTLGAVVVLNSSLGAAGKSAGWYAGAAVLAELKELSTGSVLICFVAASEELDREGLTPTIS